jgi:hypothetical protein
MPHCLLNPGIVVARRISGNSVRYVWSAAGLAAAVVVAGVALSQLVEFHQGAARLPNVVATMPTGTLMSPATASMPTTAVSTGAPQSTTAASQAPVKSQMPAKKNCAASPHVCGYPDATNTGVPAPINLPSVPEQISSGPGWSYDPRGWVEVYGNGAVLSGLYIPCNLDISASNVTIDGVEVVETGHSIGISLRHTQNVVIENSEIYSPYASGPNRLQVAIKDVYGDSTGTTVEDNNIWHVATGIQLSEGTIENNYIHDLAYTSGDHVNGITSDAGDAGDASGLAIVHNTVFNPQGQTDAISLFEDFGTQFDCLISDNLLAGGGYTVYGGANPGKWTPFNIVITNNRFARTYYPNGGYYGPAAYVDAGVAGDVWSGNVWDNTLKPVNLHQASCPWHAVRRLTRRHGCQRGK